jgi:hypothetical protein
MADLAGLGVAAGVMDGIGKLVLEALRSLVLDFARDGGLRGVRGTLTLFVGKTVGDVGRHDCGCGCGCGCEVLVD